MLRKLIFGVVLTFISSSAAVQAHIVGNLWEKASMSLMEKVIKAVEKNKHQKTFCATGGKAIKGQLSIGSFEGKLCEHRLWAAVARLACWDSKSSRSGKPFPQSTCGKKAKEVLGDAWNDREKLTGIFAERLAANTQRVQKFGCYVANVAFSAGATVAAGGIPIPPLMMATCKKMEAVSKEQLANRLKKNIGVQSTGSVYLPAPVQQTPVQVEEEIMETQVEDVPQEEILAQPESGMQEEGSVPVVEEKWF